MNRHLYRGVSELEDKRNGGLIMPKGNIYASFARSGQRGVNCGAGYVCGASVGNSVRAHQVESGMNNGAYVSTSKCKEVARRFATSGNMAPGFIYTLDMDLFERYGVEFIELPNSSETREFEISIRAKNCGQISGEVIICKEYVDVT